MESHHTTFISSDLITIHYFFSCFEIGASQDSLIFFSVRRRCIFIFDLSLLASLEILGSFLWMSLVFPSLLHYTNHRIESNQPTLVSVDQSAIIHHSDLHYSTWNLFVPFLYNNNNNNSLRISFSILSFWILMRLSIYYNNSKPL